jgi:hypothetical protein
MLFLFINRHRIADIFRAIRFTPAVKTYHRRSVSNSGNLFSHALAAQYAQMPGVFFTAFAFTHFNSPLLANHAKRGAIYLYADIIQKKGIDGIEWGSRVRIK